MKKAIHIFLILFLASSVFAYTEPPEISVIKPSGTTQIVPDDVSMSSAANSGSAGYTYRIKSGSYTVDFSSSGSSGNEIVYEAYGDGRVTILANAGGDVRITGSYIIFDGGSGKDIEFKRTSGATHIVRPEGDDITFWRIRITGPTGDCGLTDNTCVNLLDAGNSGHPARTYIYNSIISDCNHKGIYVKDANDSEIRNNVFQDNESHDIQLNPHDPGEGIDGLIIAGNIFLDGGSCGAYPGRNIYVLGTSDSDELRDVEVYNNIFYNKVKHGISFNGYSGYPQGYFRVYNNTFYSLGEYDIHVDDVMVEGNIYLANNITPDGNSIPGGIGLNSNNNAGPGFQSTSSSSANFLKITGVDKGIDTNPPVTIDYFGGDRPSGASDIGAHEYEGTTFNVTISIDTDLAATCKYDLSDVAYGSMGATFSTTGGTSHNQGLSLDCDDSYIYYTRCTNGSYTNDTSTLISFSLTSDETPPLISLLLPSGAIQCVEAEWPETTILLQLTTDEDADCKYDLSDVAYDSMQDTFETTGESSHEQYILFDCGDSGTYYVRCVDEYDNKNTSSEIAAFIIDKDPPPRRKISVH